MTRGKDDILCFGYRFCFERHVFHPIHFDNGQECMHMQKREWTLRYDIAFFFAGMTNLGCLSVNIDKRVPFA